LDGELPGRAKRAPGPTWLPEKKPIPPGTKEATHVEQHYPYDAHRHPQEEEKAVVEKFSHGSGVPEYEQHGCARRQAHKSIKPVSSLGELVKLHRGGSESLHRLFKCVLAFSQFIAQEIGRARDHASYLGQEVSYRRAQALAMLFSNIWLLVSILWLLAVHTVSANVSNQLRDGTCPVRGVGG